MIILFEGFEKSGKTTLAKELSKRLNIKYYKKANEKAIFKKNNDFFNRELSFVYETGKLIEYLDAGIITNIILDRDYISEYAYGQVFRKKRFDRLDIIEYIKMYDMQMSKHAFLIVYCYKKNYKHYQDDEVKLKYKESVEKNYNTFFEYTTNKVLKLNTEGKTKHENTDIIVDHINKIFTKKG